MMFLFAVLSAGHFSAHEPDSTENLPVWSFQFSSETPADAVKWLEGQGVDVIPPTDETKSFKLEADRDGLTITALQKTAYPAALMFRDIDAGRASLAEVEWGVEKYPEGANWDEGVNNHAIMVAFYFDTETHPSGAPWFANKKKVPNAPNFLAYFLCEHEQTQRLLTGRLYKRQGRYVCAGHPEAGEKVTSTLPLEQDYLRAFGGDTVPAVLGVSVHAYTSRSRKGRAEAIIREIRIFPSSRD